MEQLLKVTTVPFRSVRMTQNAQLLSEGSVEIERRRALARHFAFTSRNQSSSAYGAANLKNVVEINRAFSSGFRSSAPQPAVTSGSLGPAPDTVPAPQVSRTSVNQAQLSFQAAASQDVSPAAYSGEVQSSYMQERGALEMRVAKGDLTFVPPLVMTIVTQRPEIHFEYVGGPHYFPSPDASVDPEFNLSI